MSIKSLPLIPFLALALSVLWPRGVASGQTQISVNHPAMDAHPSAMATAQPAAVNNAPEDNYVIGNNDVLGISVWKEPELTTSVPVRSDGKISLPLIGEIQASGKTPTRLKNDLTIGLRAYLSSPDVTVMVLQMNSQRFNILGRVLKPGSYSLSASTTVLDAIAEAGGFQDFAKQKNIYILRWNPEGGTTHVAFNYKDVIRGNHPEENIKLRPDDTIVVP